MTAAARVGSGRDVVHQPAAMPAQARFDPARLQQVVANLLSNAGKYSPAGSPIVVTVSTDSEEVEITVTDCGTGVPVESRESVFEPFERLGHHLTSGTRGHRPGTAHRATAGDRHGRRIWVDGSAGQGAAFHVTVPRADTEVPQQACPTYATTT